MRVIDIDWDTDGQDIKNLDLPTEVEVPDDIADEIFDGGYDDDVADWLSDEYGYCVYGFIIKDD